MTKSTITREQQRQILIDTAQHIISRERTSPYSENLRELARIALAAMDSSEYVELPLDYLQGHKDGLEWAAKLAKANQPETGDWLYDDPIELAKAIRKGPDMPPVQPAPVVPGKWIPVSERMPPRIPGTSIEYLVYETLNDNVQHDYWNVPEGDRSCQAFWNHYGDSVTHWQPLPEPPQETKP